MAKRVTARARVRLTIEMAVGDSWGPDCAFDQVNKQATESAVGAIRQGIDLYKGHYSLVGTPEVTAILLQEKE